MEKNEVHSQKKFIYILLSQSDRREEVKVPLSRKTSLKVTSARTCS